MQEPCSSYPPMTVPEPPPCPRERPASACRPQRSTAPPAMASSPEPPGSSLSQPGSGSKGEGKSANHGVAISPWSSSSEAQTAPQQFSSASGLLTSLYVRIVRDNIPDPIPVTLQQVEEWSSRLSGGWTTFAGRPLHKLVTL